MKSKAWAFLSAVSVFSALLPSVSPSDVFMTMVNWATAVLFGLISIITALETTNDPR